MIYSDDERAIIWLDSFLPLTREQKLKIINTTKNPSAILKDVSLIKECVGDAISETTYGCIKASKEAGGDKEAVKFLEKWDTVALTCMSEGYPDKLLTIDDPPLVLYYRGNSRLLEADTSFSIVGSRKTLPEITAKAEEFSKELSENGVVVVTGLAEGIDAAAIRGALPSGNIISVLAGGFRHVYPEFHRSLYDKIAENGLVVSEYNPDVVSKPYFFPERNRLLAALSDGVLVCSAGKKSGTSYTADFANEYGKNVFAFPYSLGVPSGEGCNALIKEYAMLCDSTDDIFLSLGINGKKKTEKAKLSPQEETIFRCIKDGAGHIDLIMQKTGMKVFELSPILTILEIKKYIIKNPGNVYSAIK
ncbi:MAG: DNA-processing protein DprA [Clostridia bacterium]|nr:DNA-processing protein DprA [Clostridia bacterium]